MKYYIILTIFLNFIYKSSFAAKTCSRVATINYQEILVDTNSNQKGEGLRFYLENDPVSKKLLDKYQSNLKVRWPQATFGTLGTIFLLASTVSDKNSTSKDVYFYGGVGIFILNFLVAKTMERENEIYLDKAVEEYNKRNLPKIKFENSNSSRGLSAPIWNDSGGKADKLTGIYFEFSKNF